MLRAVSARTDDVAGDDGGIAWWTGSFSDLFLESGAAGLDIAPGHAYEERSLKSRRSAHGAMPRSLEAER